MIDLPKELVTVDSAVNGGKLWRYGGKCFGGDAWQLVANEVGKLLYCRLWRKCFEILSLF